MNTPSFRQLHGRWIAILCVALGAMVWTDRLFAAAALELHVAPNGRDTWSGRLPAPNADSSDGPLASITGARDALRKLRKTDGIKQPIVVRVHEGMYFLNEPLVFTPEDSGTESYPITYAAVPGQRPVISGGRVLRGWRESAVGSCRAWAVDIPEVKAGEWNFTSLYVNGQRRSRTRLPKQGYYRFTGLPGVKPDAPWSQGQTEATFAPGEIKAWEHLKDVEVVALHLWTESRMPIAAVDEPNKLVKFAKKSVFKMSEDFGPKPGRYYVENVFDALNEPGLWYLNRESGVLYYAPLPGESIEATEIAAPRIAGLMHLAGKNAEGQQVHDLHFAGLTFRHTQYFRPADAAGDAQADHLVPGLLLWQGARNCSLRGCTVENCDGYAIELIDGSSNNRIVGSVLRDLGAGGVKLNHGTHHNTVSDCEIGPGGQIHLAAVGIWVGQSSYNQIVHNHVHDFYYTGISVGWSWGYAASSANHNAVEYNHIHDLGKGVLSDMGGIYTLGVSPGTTLRYNRIHDVYAFSYGGWGIYPDEGTSEMVIENNIVYRTKTGGFHQHYGRENIVRNNIFAFSKLHQLQRTRQEDHISFTFERNIVYWDQGPLLNENWTNDKFKMNHNLYWRTDGKPIEFGKASLADWRKRGNDADSVIADPLFVDPNNGDFRLKPESPALKLGFKPIDASSVGPRLDQFCAAQGEDLKRRARELSNLKFGMFICWSFSTFSDQEWTRGVKDVSFFKPTGVDTDQWAAVAKEAGMGYILFLTKHHDGFCLWDTQTTNWKVTRSPLGKDVLASLRKSCDKYGIKLALYFSEGDWTWAGMKNPELKKAQLRELCTQYGPIEFFWMDHAQTDGGLDHTETAAWVKSFQPGCFVGFNHGQSAGDLRAGELGWPGPVNQADAGGPYVHHGGGGGGKYLVAEFTMPILGGERWFYTNPTFDKTCMFPEEIYDLYCGAVRYENIYSLDVGPDRTGRLREIDVQTLRAVGTMIRENKSLPISLTTAKPAKASTTWPESGFEAGKAVDARRGTRWGAGKEARNGWLEVDLGGPMTFSRVLVLEGHFNRVKKYELQYKDGEQWRTFHQGGKLGTLRLKVDPVTARYVRLNITEASDTPTIWEFQLFP